jgi:hypothetical protein
MNRKVELTLLLLVCFVCSGLSGCGKGNLFSWAHSSGSNTSVDALSSDAHTALADKDYAKALEYYSKILEGNPNNSEAIYGYSVASLADAGLDVSTLVANLITQTHAAPARNLAESISYIAHTPSSVNILPDTIIAQLPKMKAAVDNVLADSKLKLIVKGQGDGKIAPDDPDINLNLALCLVLRAAMTAYGAIEFDTSYNVTVTNSDPNIAKSAGKDIISAYHRLLVVIQKLHLADTGTIGNIREDVRTLFNRLSANITGLDLNIDTDYYLQ